MIEIFILSIYHGKDSQDGQAELNKKLAAGAIIVSTETVIPPEGHLGYVVYTLQNLLTV